MNIEKRYRLVYADPPWSYENEKTGRSNKSGACSKYPTMPLQEIKALPINDIAEKDAVLFIWATTPLLPDAFEVVQAWGFEYKTCIYWRKIMSLGMGYWFRGQVEVLILAIKGNIKAFRCQKANFIQTKAGKHSQKPHEVYGLIEEISKKNDLNPKIELFARYKREGWDGWGNEVPKEEQKLLVIA